MRGRGPGSGRLGARVVRRAGQGEGHSERRRPRERALVALSALAVFALVAAVVFGTLAWTIKNSFASDRQPAEKVEATVKQIGDALMTKFVLPLEVIGLLLTAALIGAVIIAMKEEKK